MVSNVRNSKVRLNENNQNRTSNIVSKQADVTKIEPKGQEIKNDSSKILKKQCMNIDIKSCPHARCHCYLT